MSRIPSSSSVPSLTSLALSLSASAQPLTHSCCQSVSPAHCVSAPIEKVQHICASPMFHVRSSDRIAAPGKSASPPPDHAPRTFPPFLSTPLRHELWPRRSSSSTQDSPRSLSRDSQTSSVSKPTADSPTHQPPSPRSEASPAPHQLSAAPEVIFKRSSSMLPQHARHRPGNAAGALAPSSAERSNFRRATDSVRFSSSASVRKPPAFGHRRSSRGRASVSEELQPVSAAHRSSPAEPLSSAARLRPHTRSFNTRIALGVTNRAAGAQTQAPERLSFDFRDDEPSATLDRGRPVAASGLSHSTGSAGTRAHVRSFQSVFHGHRSWKTMQGSDTDADASEVPLVRARSAAPSPPLPPSHQTLPSRNSAFSSFERQVSRSQDHVWEQGSVWQFDEPRTAASYYGAQVASGVASGKRASQASASAVQGRAKATFAVQNSHTAQPSSVGGGSAWSGAAATAAAIPRSMRMKQNSVVLPDEEDACNPWQLGTEPEDGNTCAALLHANSQMLACTNISPTSEPCGALSMQPPLDSVHSIVIGEVVRRSELHNEAAEPDTGPTCMRGVMPVPTAEASYGARQNGAFVQFEHGTAPKHTDAEQLMQSGLKAGRQGIHLPMNTSAPPRDNHKLLPLQVSAEQPGAAWKELHVGIPHGLHMKLVPAPFLTAYDHHRMINNQVEHPCILASFDRFLSLASGKRLVVFLDYDGTLTPIVSDPDLALMSESMRGTVKRVAETFPTAIISGRGRKKVESFVKLDELFYAGSHGLDIKGPVVKSVNGEEHEALPLTLEGGLLTMMSEVRKEAEHAIRGIPGATVEDNTCCVSLHFRNCTVEDWPKVVEAAQSIVSRRDTVHMTRGRKVVEIRPWVDWDKGKALLHLLRALGLDDSDDVIPLYIGDDVTDEDAFKVIKGRGVGVLVSTRAKPTAAEFVLRDPDEVGRFLERVVDWGNSSLNAWHQNPTCVGWEANQSTKATSALDSAAAPVDTQGMHHVSSLSSVSTQAYLNHPASSQHAAPDLDAIPASPSQCSHAAALYRAHPHNARNTCTLPLPLPTSQHPTYYAMDLDSSRTHHSTPTPSPHAQSDYLTALQDQRQRSCHLSLQRRVHDPHAASQTPSIQDTLACASIAARTPTSSVNAYAAARAAVPMSASDINSSASTVDSGVHAQSQTALSLSTGRLGTLQASDAAPDSLQRLQSISAAVAVPPQPQDFTMSD